MGGSVHGQRRRTYERNRALGQRLGEGVQEVGLAARRPDQCRITRLATPSKNRYESTIEVIIAWRLLGLLLILRGADDGQAGISHDIAHTNERMRYVIR